MIRKFSWVVVLLYAASAVAATYGGAAGVNKKGELVAISGEMAEFLVVYRDATNNHELQRFDMKKECPDFVESADKFSCRKNSQSPLSGATYQITIKADYRPCKDAAPNFYQDAGTVYVCLTGCENPRTPAIFYVAPMECV